ncbi:DUF7344 domain-containing protein [Salinigranum salinum]|uniref:DUF7344 domain-containing protein n=1 Tax=Salinigranum salinum TaxID=1364937 RepID=UPI001863DB4A|nr:hypothetical protein [Salinigranum salinum]
MSVDTTSTALEQSPSEEPLTDQIDDADGEAFGPDEIFHLLQNQRRRQVLRRLRDVEDRVAMGDLAEQVAAWEHDTTVEALTSSERQRVYIALYQRHLPKLDDMDVIDYNQSRGVVEPRPRAASVTSYLDLATDDGSTRGPIHDSAGNDDAEEVTAPADRAGADDHRDAEVPWQTYTLGTTGVAAVVLALTALDVSVFATVPELGVAAAVVAAVLLLSVAQRRD